MKNKCITAKLTLFVVFVVLAFGYVGATFAETGVMKSKGQTVYAAAYSHIYSGNREQQFSLAVTLSIRNTDPQHPITVTAVDYYNSAGKLVEKYLKEPGTLEKMSTIRYVVKESDKAGGSGANFIITWTSRVLVNQPLIETVMIGTQAQQGLSFTSRGQVIE